MNARQGNTPHPNLAGVKNGSFLHTLICLIIHSEVAAMGNGKLWPVLAGLSAGVLLTFAFPQARRPAQAPAAAPSAPDAITFRVVFGYRRAAPKNYDGSVSITGGTLRAIDSWRFLQGDAITPPDSWKLQIRRMVFENQPDAPN